MIISASRRTDIPAFYSDWFINRLNDGYVLVRNPMNHSQISKIILSKEVVDCIVFWSKDPSPMLSKLPLIDKMGYKYYFQFTLTPYDKSIEQNMRDKQDIVNTFIALSKIIGAKKVLWRYDPIILNDNLTICFHIAEFKKLCAKLSGYTQVCSISFVDIYSKLSRRVKSEVLRKIEVFEMQELAQQFINIGKEYGIEVRACCEVLPQIKKASCIDRELIEDICGYSLDAKSDKNQRNGCSCVSSADIGAYNTCKHGCVYCYANYSENSVNKNCLSHSDESDILVGSVGIDEKITERRL